MEINIRHVEKLTLKESVILSRMEKNFLAGMGSTDTGAGILPDTRLVASLALGAINLLETFMLCI